MAMITYVSPNGFKGVLYGESSLSIYAADGHEILHTGSRSIDTYDELVDTVEQFPSFYKAFLNAHIEDDDEDDGV